MEMTEAQSNAVKAYRDQLALIGRERRYREPIRRELIRDLATTIDGLALVGVKISDPPLINSRPGRDALTHLAQACVLVNRPYSSVRNLIFPQFWKPCIRVFKQIDFIGPKPTVGVIGKGKMREFVYPFFPAKEYQMVTQLNLRFSVNAEEEYQRVDFNIIDGDELGVDEGDIIAQSVTGTNTSLMIIDKHIRFKSETPLARQFALFPEQLGKYLKRWLADAANECGPCP